MEPRPPRPRQQYLPPAAAAAGGFQRGSGGTEQGLYAPPPGYSPPPAYPPELELVPRRTRHRQRIARNVLLALLVVAAIGVLGWNVRERFFGAPANQNLAQVAPTEPANQPVTGAVASPDAAEGAVPTQAPLVNNLLATSTPTPASAGESRAISGGNTDDAEPTATAAAAAAEDEEPADEQVPVDLATLLPSEAELPVQDLVMTDSGERSLDDVTSTFGSVEASAEAEEFLTKLGWTANVYSEFAADPTTLAPDATTVLTVSIHQFADQASASEALTYFSNVVVAVQGFDEGQADPVGDEIRLLRGVGEDGTTNVAAYVVDGPLLFRIGGSSPAGDPTGHVLQLADDLVNRE